MFDRLTYGWPRCARCNKLVDRMERADDVHREVDVFTAFCHGESEAVGLYLETVQDSTRIVFGLAFERPALEAMQ